ncbi:MAG: YraN family protein [Candidatus Kapaibacterium sp.]
MDKEIQHSRGKGSQAEQLAADFLEQRGMKIVKMNFHFGRHGEIDIIARDGEMIVFVEVKARKSFEYGSPVESITPRKIKALRRAAEGWLYVNKISDTGCRFDFVGIDQRSTPPTIDYIPNAF